MGHVEHAGISTWAVYRQDDLGNRFLVRTGLGREDAGRLAAELEARGHRQIYWIEPDHVTPPNAAGSLL
jgi:hypothetical protein